MTAPADSSTSLVDARMVTRAAPAHRCTTCAGSPRKWSTCCANGAIRSKRSCNGDAAVSVNKSLSRSASQTPCILQLQNLCDQAGAKLGTMPAPCVCLLHPSAAYPLLCCQTGDVWSLAVSLVPAVFLSAAVAGGLCAIGTIACSLLAEGHAPSAMAGSQVRYQQMKRFQ